MKISRSELMKKIRKEFEEGRKWSDMKHGYCFQMMLDTSDADIWTDCFIDVNTWKRYHSKTIIKLSYYGVTVKEQEEYYLSQAVQLLKEAGWEITD